MWLLVCWRTVQTGVTLYNVYFARALAMLQRKWWEGKLSLCHDWMHWWCDKSTANKEVVMIGWCTSWCKKTSWWEKCHHLSHTTTIKKHFALFIHYFDISYYSWNSSTVKCSKLFPQDALWMAILWNWTTLCFWSKFQRNTNCIQLKDLPVCRQSNQEIRYLSY